MIARLSARRPTHRASRRGSVIVAMLGLVAILGAMLVSFTGEATERIKYTGLLDVRTDLRPTAYSALEITLAVLSEIAEIDGGLRAPSQGWNDPLAYSRLEAPFPEGFDVTIDIKDESSRLPLARMGKDELEALFYMMDIPSYDAEKLANLLLDWMDANDYARLNSSDGDDYLRMDPPYWAANAVPTSWDDFRRIEGYNELFWDEDGQPTPQFAQFRDAVSLINTGKVNINSAGPLVISVLAHLGGVDVQSIENDLAGFDGERGTSDDRIVSQDSTASWLENVPLASYTIDLLRVRVNARSGDAAFTVDALVRWKGANPGAGSTSPGMQTGWELFPEDARAALGYPFEIVELRENQKID